MNSSRIIAKALNLESKSDAIVVSFGSEWYESLRGKRFTSVIRKRVPATTKPHWLYFHINSPVSAICGRAEIISVNTIDRATSLDIRRELDLSKEQILSYFGRQETMGRYELGRVLFPEKELSTEQISAHMVYHPPQSFVALSNDAKKLLDQLCGFQENAAPLREASRT